MRKRTTHQAVLAVRAVLVRPRDKNILLVKRSSNSGWDPGRWEFPGGKVEAGQDFKGVLKLEVGQETKLRVYLRDVEIITGFWRMNGSKSSRGNYIELIFGCKKFTGRPRMSPEHDEIGWMTLKEVRSLGRRLTPGARKVLYSREILRFLKRLR